MPPTEPAASRPARNELFVLGAESREALAERAGELGQALETRPGLRPVDLAFTLATDPQEGPHRLAVLAASMEELARKLRHAAGALRKQGARRIRDRSGIYWFDERLAGRGRVAFVFPGEGAQYPHMLSGLCMAFPEARACFDRIDRVFADHQRGYLPSQFIFPREAGEEDRLWQMDGAVEAVFTANAALHAVLDRLGVRPDMIVGHSTGDYSALMASGCISTDGDEELLGLMLDLNGLYRRLEEEGRIPHAMLVAVGSVEPGAARTLVEQSGGAIQLAMDNCPHQFVLAGSRESLEPVAERLRRDGAILEELPFSRAYHTPGFASVCRDLTPFYGRLPIRPPRVEIWSAATAAPLPPEPESIRRISVAQWAQPVRFAETVEAMYEEGARIFVEAGPRGNLTAFITDILRGRPHLAVPADLKQRPGIDQLLHLAGMLCAHGVPVNLEPLFHGRGPARVDLKGEAAPARPRRVMTLATGWPEMRLTVETARRIREALGGSGEGLHGEPPARRPREAPGVPAPPAARAAPPVAPPPDGPAGDLLAAHFRTMEKFLQVQDEVMNAALSGRGAPLEEAGAESADAAGEPSPPARPAAAQEAPAAEDAGVPAPGTAPAAPGSSPSQDRLRETLIRLVGDRTGYPADMIDEDLDLEADLGIDSIKRVEILGSFRKETGLAGAADMDRLSACRTLRQILETVSGEALEEAPRDGAPGPAPGGADHGSGAAATRAAAPEERIREALVRLVGDRTGYPADMIGLDLDLEADLGIDSIKRVEILGAFQKEMGPAGAGDMEELQGRRTLREIIRHVAEMEGGAGARTAAPASPPEASGEEPPGGAAERRAIPQELPFIREITVHRPGRSLTARVGVRRDEALFLRHHCLGRDVSRAHGDLTGLPVVPLTMTMEMLAEAAAALAPGKVVTGMREVRGHRWLVMDGETLDLELKAESVDGGVHVRLFEVPGAGTAPPLAEATVVLGDGYPPPAEPAAPALRGERPSRWDSERLYRDGMFHGPVFQGVDSMDLWAEDGAVATLRSLPARGHFRGKEAPSYVTDPVLLDQPGQVVGFWTAEHLERGYVVFPFRLEALDLYGPPAAPGEIFTCRAAIRLEGDDQVRSDLDVVDRNGSLHARLAGWWDRRFDLPRPFAELLLSPAETFVGSPWPAGAASAPETAAFRGAEVDSAIFPEGFFSELGGFWAEVLARVVLGSEERRQWRSLSLPGPRKVEWLLGRVAAKDAARRLLVERHGLHLPPADVEVIKSPDGRPALAGAWAAGLGERLTVSLSHADGMAVALAGPVPEGNGNGAAPHGVGVDVERLGRVRGEFAGAAFSDEERSLFAGLSGDQREEWTLRAWCAKEAVAKALGTGFMGNPRNLIARRLDIATGSVDVTMAPAMRGSLPGLGEGPIAARTWRDRDRIYGTSTCERSSE